MAGARWKHFLHPVGLVILVFTAILAGVIEARAPWSDRAGWAILWGVLAYGATVLVSAASRSASRSTHGIAPAAGGEHPRADPPLEDLVPFTEEALRRLNDLAALASCSLAARIPRTLSERQSDGEPPASTPLEVAGILRVVMVDGIERLKPTNSAGRPPVEAEVLRYAILHEEYVLGRPNDQIMARHNVSESTFHRYRRVGTRALAAELAKREHLLSQERRLT